MKVWLAFLFLAVSSSAFGATTCYVDLACPIPGNGTGGYTNTCDGTAAGNPAAAISTCIAALGASDPDSIINIFGIHSSHGSCPGSTTGNYQADEIRVQGKNGTNGHPIIIQNNGYTGSMGSGEPTFIDGVGDVSWTQCSWNGSTCDCGSDHSGIQIGDGGQTACLEAWFFVGSGNQQRALSCAKTDGTPCFRVGSIGHTTIDATSLALMKNSGSGYLATTCSVSTWIKCTDARDCPLVGETCSGSTSEVDSVSDECKADEGGTYCATTHHNGTIIARWGANARGPVVFDNNGNGFAFCNSNYFTVQGLNFRNFVRAHLQVADTGNGGCSGVSDHITITKNTFAYGHHNGGSDYQVLFHNATTVGPITDNYFAHAGSESIHVDPHSSGATVMTIQRNFIFDNGDPSVLGSRGGFPINGTPEGMTLTDNSGTGGDYAGSDVSDNLIYKVKKNGIILENIHSNSKVHDNIFFKIGRTAIKFAADTAAVSGNQIYNNLIISPCLANQGDAGIWVADGAGTADANVIMNNTVIIDPTIPCSALASSGTPTNTVVRNNLFYIDGSFKLVDWTPAGTFTNNLVFSSTLGSGTLVKWNGSNYTCSTLTSLDVDSKCTDPLFFSNVDFHLRVNSPAVDSGTTTGMPINRLTGLINSLDVMHGLPDYNAWCGKCAVTPDIGADEFNMYDIIYGLTPPDPGSIGPPQCSRPPV